MPNERLYNRIFQKKEFLDAKRPLPEAVLSRVREELHTEFVFNSNAIEGNTLTLKETRRRKRYDVRILTAGGDETNPAWRDFVSNNRI